MEGKEKKIKTILFIFPPTILSNIGNVKVCVPPLGIAQLGAVCRKEGYEVKLLDAIVEGYDNLVPMNDKYNMLGLGLEDIENRIWQSKPDVVGVSCLFSPQYYATREICKRIKRFCKDIITIVGGPHPSFFAESCLKTEPTIDYIVIGEGEDTVVNILNKINDGKEVTDLNGIAFRHQGKVIVRKREHFIENLDALPFPAFDLLPMEKYFTIDVTHDLTKIRKRSLGVMTSRGCPGKCVFCSSFKYWGNRYRAKSPQRVLDEIELLIREYEVSHIEFIDDNFTLNRKRLIQILEGIQQRNLKISWATPNAVNLNTINKDILCLIKKSGCQTLTLAIESGNQDFLNKFIKKKIDLDKAVTLTKAMKKLGIRYNAFFIVGFPNETRAQIQETFRFARKLDPFFGFFFLASPLPGSDLYEIVKEKRFLNEEFDFEMIDYGRANFRTQEMRSDELEDLYYQEYMKYLISNFFHHPVRFLPYLFGKSELSTQVAKVIRKGLTSGLRKSPLDRFIRS